jgi:beta-xylosidase
MTSTADRIPSRTVISAILSVAATMAMILGVATAAHADVTSGLILKYDLTQSNGTTITDASGSGNNGTLVGAGTWAGADGLALDGSSAYVKLPNNLMASLSAITVSTQVLVSPAQKAPYFIWGLGNPATSNSGTGYLFASGDAERAGITRTNWSGENIASKGSNIVRGVWKTITYTQTGTTGTLYEDGVQVAQNTSVSVLPSEVGGGSTTQDFLGKSDYAADNLLSGSLKDFRVYNRALTASEVSSLAPSDQQRIDNDAADLSLGDTSAVTSDLKLPATGTWGSKITWSSSNPAVISNSGAVTRGGDDQTATLTASLTSGSAVETKAFTVTVPAQLPAQQRAQAAANDVVVHNIDNVRGYLTLPATGEYGATIAWSSSDPSTIDSTGVVNRPAAGSATKSVQLTASATVSGVTATHVITATVPPLPAPAADTGYMFAYFAGNTTAGENIYFAQSKGNNALSWRTRNGGKPMLTSTMDTKGLRDPFLMRSADGDHFYALATDLSIGSGTSWGDASSRGSLYLEVYESDDLVHWSAQRHIYVGPAGAGDAWAPEATWVPSLGEYMIYWAANTTLDGNTYHRTYVSYTRDFWTVSAPQLWDDPGSSVIDTTVLQDNGNFYRFTKDEGHVTGCADILQEKNTNLLAVRNDPHPDQATSPAWTPQANCIGAKAGLGAVEGPTAFRANPGDTSGYKYYLFVDQYSGTGYAPLGTNDLDNPNWTVPASYKLPADPRHGSVLPVTAAEMQALNALNNDPAPATANADGEIVDYPMTQTSGTAVSDASGNGHDASLVGNGTWTGTSLALDGSSAYVKMPNNVMAGLDSITVSSDVYLNSGQQTPYFIWGMGNTDASGTGNGYLFTTGDNYRTSIGGGNWTTEQTVGNTAPLSRAGWNSIAYTLTGGTARLYLNGVQVAQKTGVTIAPGDIGSGTTTANYIGKSVYNSDHLLSGQVKNFRIYNRALAAGEVAALADPTLILGSTSSQLKSTPVITGGANLVALPVKPGTDVTSFDPKLTVPTGSTLSETGPQDYSSPRRITVTSAAGATRTWTVAAHVMNSPLIPLFADPNIARFGDTYYMYGTTDGFPGWGSTTFEVYTSKDLVNWTDGGKILDLADVSWGHTNAWAPTIAYKNGTYYFYYCDAQSIGVATSSSPTGPFADKGSPLVAKGAYSGQMIDPDVFTDSDGTSYLYWGNGNAYVVPLNADMESYDSSKVVKLTSQLTNFTEGSFMVKRNGIYYLSYSNGDTGNADYNVQYAMGTSPMGPFTYKGVILQQDPTLGIYATGHESMIQVPGTDDWYMAYHRFAIPGGDGQHRETTIDTVTFNADGTIKPIVPTLESVPALTFNGTPPTASLSNSDGRGIGQAPEARSYGVGATLTLTAGQNTAKVQYRIDGGTWATYSSPVTLPRGQHTIDYQAQGTDLIWDTVQSLTVKVAGGTAR